jgi:hypothetical protein
MLELKRTFDNITTNLTGGTMKNLKVLRLAVVLALIALLAAPAFAGGKKAAGGWIITR